jgi:hypothetical protein
VKEEEEELFFWSSSLKKSQPKIADMRALKFNFKTNFAL